MKPEELVRQKKMKSMDRYSLDELERCFKDIREKQEVALRNVRKANNLVGKWIEANEAVREIPDEELTRDDEIKLGYLAGLYGAVLVTDVSVSVDNKSITINFKSIGGLVCYREKGCEEMFVRGQKIDKPDSLTYELYDEFPDFKIITFDEVKDLYSKMFDEAKAFAFDTLEILKGEAK